MNTHWRRIAFLILIVGLPLFAAASATKSFCPAVQEEMVYVHGDSDIQCNNCTTSCSTAPIKSCDMGAACGSCVAPSAVAPDLSHFAFLLPVYPTSSAAGYASHIVELLERPPKDGRFLRFPSYVS